MTAPAPRGQGTRWQGVASTVFLLVGLLAGDAASGIYGGAIRFIQAGMVVDTALRVVVSPQFSKLLHQGKTKELRDLYSTPRSGSSCSPHPSTRSWRSTRPP